MTIDLDKLTKECDARLLHWQQQIRFHETELKVSQQMADEAKADLEAIKRTKTAQQRIDKQHAMEGVAP